MGLKDILQDKLFILLDDLGGIIARHGNDTYLLDNQHCNNGNNVLNFQKFGKAKHDTIMVSINSVDKYGIAIDNFAEGVPVGQKVYEWKTTEIYVDNSIYASFGYKA